MSSLALQFRAPLAGGLLGALVLGLGGRFVMRLLTFHDGRQPGFSAGGTAEIIAYGAIVGAVAGLIYSLLPKRVRHVWPIAGSIAGIAAYAGTLLTLPPHIAETVEPFSGILPLVHLGFGLCFIAFGLLLGRVARK